MGGAMSNPLDAEKQERMKEICEEVIQTFTVEFAKGYKSALIAQAKREAGEKILGGNEPEYQLVGPPPDAEVIKVGQLEKQGAVRKSWKTRTFVALNEKDNYQIFYYADKIELPDGATRDDIPKGKKPKGVIKLAGYHTKNIEMSGGKHCLSIEGHDEDQRAWKVRSDNQEDIEAWQDVFGRACSKSWPQKHEDEIVRAAFQQAYSETRWAMHLWGWWSWSDTEEEMLSRLLKDVLHYRLLSSVYSEIPSGKMHNMTVDLVKKVVNGTVTAAASSGWKAADTSMSSVKGTLNAAVKQVIAPIVELEPKLQSQILEKVKPMVLPKVQELASSRGAKVLEVFIAPLGQMFVFGLKGWTTKAGSGDFHVYGSDGMLAYGGDSSVKGKHHQMTGGGSDLAKALDAVGEFLSGYSIMDIAQDCVNEVEGLMRKANHDTRSLGNNVGQTTGKLKNDMTLALTKFVHGLVRSAIFAPLGEATKELLDGVLDPFQSMVPETLNEFLDLKALLSACIDSLIDEVVNAMCAPALKPHLDAIAA